MTTAARAWMRLADDGSAGMDYLSEREVVTVAMVEGEGIRIARYLPLEPAASVGAEPRRIRQRDWAWASAAVACGAAVAAAILILVGAIPW